MPAVCARPAMLPLIQHRLAQGLGRQRALVARALRIMAAQQHEKAQAQHAAESPMRQSLSVLAASHTATQLLAHYFACELQSADCYLLYGSVGAGKSYFSRAFIRAAAGDEELLVPSPTFLLQNMYTDHKGPPIHHFDLYRLTQQYNLALLDLRSSFAQAVCLVEWPERLGPQHQPAEHLAVHISILEAAEQQRLQQQHVTAGSSLEGLREQSCREKEEEEGGSGSDEDSSEVRWRRIRLTPAGNRWLPRLQLLQRLLKDEGSQLGCYMESGLLV